MKAAVIDRFGGPEEIYYTDIEKPVPGPDEVLVRNVYIGVGKPDYIYGAAGGVGTAVIQTALLQGIEVIASASSQENATTLSLWEHSVCLIIRNRMPKKLLWITPEAVGWI